jgi:elongation factor P hydroxylase
LGIAVHSGSPARNFGWDGSIMRAGTEAYVLLHEIAHYLLAPQPRRRRREFGLGPGPETGHRAAAERATMLTGMAREREEAKASLLGILWEAALGQPALASFLDQNWLEGADPVAHFERMLAALMRDGLVNRDGKPHPGARKKRRQA